MTADVVARGIGDGECGGCEHVATEGHALEAVGIVQCCLHIGMGKRLEGKYRIRWTIQIVGTVWLQHRAIHHQRCQVSPRVLKRQQFLSRCVVEIEMGHIVGEIARDDDGVYFAAGIKTIVGTILLAVASRKVNDIAESIAVYVNTGQTIAPTDATHYLVLGSSVVASTCTKVKGRSVNRDTFVGQLSNLCSYIEGLACGEACRIQCLSGGDI